MRPLVLFLFIANHFAFLCLILIVATAAGTALLGMREQFSIRCAAGLALCAHGAFALAAIDQLRPLPIISVLLFIAAAAVARLSSDRVLARPVVTPVTTRWEGIALRVFAAFLFVLALYPAHAFDETTYHLPFVREFAQYGGLRLVADLGLPV